MALCHADEGHGEEPDLIAMIMLVVVGVPEALLVSGQAVGPSCAWALAAEVDAEHQPAPESHHDQRRRCCEVYDFDVAWTPAQIMAEAVGLSSSAQNVNTYPLSSTTTRRLDDSSIKETKLIFPVGSLNLPDELSVPGIR